MGYRDFSRTELTLILEIIHSSLACRNNGDLQKLLAMIKDLVSADHGICGIGAIQSGQLSDVKKIFNLDYPEKWMELYASRELYKVDPIIRHKIKTKESYFWKDATERLTNKEDISFMNLAGEFGLRYGVASGFQGARSGLASIFSFSGGGDRFKNHHKKILDTLIPHVHIALEKICAIERKKATGLSIREQEVLAWVKEGKTNWEISMILSISERTVKFHVQNIEHKLNAVNKAHAIALAMESGLVQ
ncbi:MAG: LuxR C-terminal-related transcriptional regulator [Thermodesulfobacteriota bacterium]